MQLNCLQPFGLDSVQEVKISDHRVLAQGEDVKTCYEITLDLPYPVDYPPGVTVGVLARNRLEEVDTIMTALGFDSIADKPCHLTVKQIKKTTKLPVFVPEYITVRRVLLECLDIRSVPKKLLLRELAEHTTDEEEERFLQILCSKEGAAIYNDFVLQRNNFLSLVSSLKTCRPPFEVLIEHLPRLQPRPYSICNAPQPTDESPQIKFVFSVADGLVTTWMETLLLSNKSKKILEIYFRLSTMFQYAEEEYGRNIIMVGPGTSVAPYLGFLERRKQLMGGEIKFGKAWLFTGCRYKERNHLYKVEIDQFLKEGVLDRLSEAFSRDPGSQVKYVQDAIKAERADFVRWLLEEDTVLYVCGEGKKMLPDIQRAVVEAIAEVTMESEEDALIAVKELKRCQKYIEDIWI